MLQDAPDCVEPNLPLVAAARREGDIVGEVHVVATGETLIVPPL